MTLYTSHLVAYLVTLVSNVVTLAFSQASHRLFMLLQVGNFALESFKFLLQFFIDVEDNPFFLGIVDLFTQIVLSV